MSGVLGPRPGRCRSTSTRCPVRRVTGRLRRAEQPRPAEHLCVASLPCRPVGDGRSGPGALIRIHPRARPTGAGRVASPNLSRSPPTRRRSAAQAAQLEDSHGVLGASPPAPDELGAPPSTPARGQCAGGAPGAVRPASRICPAQCLRRRAVAVRFPAPRRPAVHQPRRRNTPRDPAGICLAAADRAGLPASGHARDQRVAPGGARPHRRARRPTPRAARATAHRPGPRRRPAPASVCPGSWTISASPFWPTG